MPEEGVSFQPCPTPRRCLIRPKSISHSGAAKGVGFQTSSRSLLKTTTASGEEGGRRKRKTTARGPSPKSERKLVVLVGRSCTQSIASPVVIRAREREKTEGGARGAGRSKRKEADGAERHEETCALAARASCRCANRNRCGWKVARGGRGAAASSIPPPPRRSLALHKMHPRSAFLGAHGGG